MYRYNFTLKLTTTLFQKLATLYMWNVKQKDDGMGQNTLHCRYGEYVTTNQQTWINKTCCHDFASLHVTLRLYMSHCVSTCHIVFKDL